MDDGINNAYYYYYQPKLIFQKRFDQVALPNRAYSVGFAGSSRGHVVADKGTRGSATRTPYTTEVCGSLSNDCSRYRAFYKLLALLLSCQLIYKWERGGTHVLDTVCGCFGPNPAVRIQFRHGVMDIGGGPADRLHRTGLARIELHFSGMVVLFVAKLNNSTKSLARLRADILHQ